MLTAEEIDLKEKIDAFVDYVAKVCEPHYGEFSKVTLSVTYGDRWAKVIKHLCNGQESVYAFIALEDFGNKTLGMVKKGDIHRPASWKVPARHARGSVFQEGYNNCVGPWGIAYLK